MKTSTQRLTFRLLFLAAMAQLAAPQVMNAQATNPQVTGPQANTSPARTYYVDSEAGDDARSGLQASEAWRTLEKVNRAPLAPGDRVLFRRGQFWRGQLRPQNGAAGAAITYGAFGEGAKPLLLGSVALDREQDWQPEGNGVWTTLPLRFEATGESVDLRPARRNLHQEAGAQCVLARETDAAEGNLLRLTCTNSGTRSNHLQLSISGLNIRAGEYYEFTFRARATRAFQPASIALMKSTAPWTSYADGSGALAAIGTEWADFTVRFHTRESANDAGITLYLGGALPADATLLLQPQSLSRVRANQTTPLSADVGNIIFDGGASTGVKKWSVADLRIEGDYFYDRATWQVKLLSDGNPARRHKSIELALRRHIIDQGGRGYVTYEDLDLRYGAAHGIGGGSTHHITVRRCDISFVGGGHQFTGTNGKPVRFGNGIEFWADARDCMVEDCRIWEIYDAALTNQGDGVNVQENITYRRNVIWNSEYSFEFWNRGPASRTNNIVFEQNTCIAAGYGWGHSQRPDPNGRHLMFYDNTAATTGIFVRDNIFCTATDSAMRLTGADWTAALTMDRNVWWQPQGPMLRWGNQEVGANDFLAFMRQRGFDTHSIVADPRFVDPARRDYRLTPDSPARAFIKGYGISQAPIRVGTIIRLLWFA